MNAADPLVERREGHTGPTVAVAHPLPLPLLIAVSIPACIIILLTILGNLLVLRFKARVGRTNTTLLVWNLGLTDFLVGLFVLPLGAIHLIQGKWIFGRLMCRTWVAMDVTFCTCSVVTICIISVDRYMAVTRPLQYKSYVTKGRVIFVMVLIWTFSMGILLATVRWEGDTQPYNEENCFAGDEIRYLAHSVVFAFFLPASVTLTLYWRIYRLARNRQRALDRGFLVILGHNMNFLTSTLSQQTALRVHIGKKNGMVEHQRRVLRTHERIAKTLGVVSCSFLFCWLPFFTLYLTNFGCDGCLPTMAIDIASWLGYCNSMLNPIIYSFTVKEFKRSSVRATLPLWHCFHRLCPMLVSRAPAHRQLAKISRNVGDKSKVVGRRRHGAGTKSRSNTPSHNRSAIRRRVTEPVAHDLSGGELLVDKADRRIRSVIVEEGHEYYEQEEGEIEVGKEHTEANSVLTPSSLLISKRHSDTTTGYPPYSQSPTSPPLPPSALPYEHNGRHPAFYSWGELSPEGGSSDSDDIDEDEIIQMPCRYSTHKRHSLPGITPLHIKGGGGGLARFLPLRRHFAANYGNGGVQRNEAGTRRSAPPAVPPNPVTAVAGETLGNGLTLENEGTTSQQGQREWDRLGLEAKLSKSAKNADARRQQSTEEITTSPSLNSPTISTQQNRRRPATEPPTSSSPHALCKNPSQSSIHVYCLTGEADL